MRAIALLFGLVLSAPACSSNLQNEDVKRFVTNADLCEHFAGEWGSELPKAERKRIERSIDKYCGNAKRQMRRLQTKYKGDAEIDQLVNKYESVQSY